MPPTPATPPTVFHITHWKSGSQWIHRILLDLAGPRVVAPQVNETQFLERPLVAGGVYPTVYVTREQFDSVPQPGPYRRFVVIRDLRDTLVSGYFSIRYSHPMIASELASWRDRLAALSTEDGLLMLMDEWLPLSARIQESWLRAGEPLIRYEDMLADDLGVLDRVLIGQCALPVTPAQLQAAVARNRFEALSGGRKAGEEDLQAHERKGICGDWKNHFTPRVTNVFLERHGELLARAGYDAP